MPEPMQNPQTVDNSAVTDGTNAGTNPTGEGLSLAQAMGYDPNGSKPTEDKAPATDTAKTSEGSDPKKDEPKVPTWADQLTDELKGDGKTIKTLSKFNSVSDLAKSYTELQKLMGNRIELPKEDADEEALTAFWTKLGKPKTAKEYSTGEEAGDFNEIAFASNLTDSQASAVYKALKDKGIEMVEKQRVELKTQYETVDKNLRDEYGPQYETKKRMLDKGLKAWGGNDVAQVLISTGAMFNEAIVKMFIKMGEAVTESGSTNAAGTGALNTYKSRRDGGGFTVKL